MNTIKEVTIIRQALTIIFGYVLLCLREVQIKFTETSHLTIQTNLNFKQMDQHNLRIQHELNS